VNDWTADFPGKSALPTKHTALQTSNFSMQLKVTPFNEQKENYTV